MELRWFIAAAVALFMMCGGGVVMAERILPPEQLRFSAEDVGVKKPVPVSAEVMELLERQEGVRLLLAEHKTEQLPASWVSASTIHLSNSGESCLVVQGEGPILGANVTTFWVICGAAEGRQVVLTAYAHDLVVRRKRSNGYLEIATMSATASTVATVRYRFDGKQYAAH